MEEGEGYRIDGHKKFISMADYADILFVAVNAGAGSDGRKRIRIAVIDPGLEGVRIERMPELPFIPEVGHAEVFLKNVMISADALLPGDGYTAYIKPFRSVEDIQIFAAVTGYLYRITSEYRWDLTFREELLEVISSLKVMSMEDALSESLHIALAGLITRFGRFLEAAESQWSQVDEGIRALWERDRKLLDVAGTLRKKRLSRAWEKYL
jgi:acyl-CoA dehydrogenase